jgi:putative heme-binding domain-containing protein
MRNGLKHLSLVCFTMFAVSEFAEETALAQGKGKQKPETPEAKLQADFKAPPGFNHTIFAKPPDANYPTCLYPLPNGELFIGSDQDGSLGKAPNMGRVIRAVDTKGTGKADAYNIFCEVEHPRGLYYDDGKMWICHPPDLSVYYDDKRVGKANRSEVLVKGISSEKGIKSRGADHTTNNIRMAIDGWIYIAVGDFGMLNAVGKDGTKLTMRGGIARVRPDGTCLEQVTWGSRNIYDIAIDPYLNLFCRDNTNDGRGWDTRFHHMIPTATNGYPNLFANFADETNRPLYDFGGGGPTGALFTDEPLLPKPYDKACFLVEWGKSVINRAFIEPNGASFKIGQPKHQEDFVRCNRPTVIDTDGAGRLYVASWYGGNFDYVGPYVGYVAQMTPKNFKPTPFPDLKKATDAELVDHVTGPGGTLRLRAQHEILRRGEKEVFAKGLEKFAAGDGLLAGRVAAIFTLKLLQGEKSHPALVKLVGNDAVREFALKALADDKRHLGGVPIDLFVKALDDPNPRVRLQAVIGLGRFGKKEIAGSLVSVLADADPSVAHVAYRNLALLGASEVCLKALSVIDPLVESRFKAADSERKAAEAELTVWIAKLRAYAAINERIKEVAKNKAGAVSRSELQITEALEQATRADVEQAKAKVTFAQVNLEAPDATLLGIIFALQLMPERAVVDGLIQNLEQTKNSKVRQAILRGLARLYFQEKAFDGTWWGTQPNTKGPYYSPVKWAESDKIAAALTKIVPKADSPTLAVLLQEVNKCNVPLKGKNELTVKLAATDAKYRAQAVDILAGQDDLDADALALLSKVVLDGKGTEAVRAKALRGMSGVAFKRKDLGVVVPTLATLGAGELPKDLATARNAFITDIRTADHVDYLAKLLQGEGANTHQLVYTVLLQVAGNRQLPQAARNSADKLLEAAWSRPAGTVSLLKAIGDARAEEFALQIKQHLTDKNAEVKDAAKYAAQRIDLDALTKAKSGPTVGTMKYEEVFVAALKEKGDVERGRRLFLKQGCILCHTIAPEDTPKGPPLYEAGTRYKRDELLESILKPSAKIAQGFETRFFSLNDGKLLEGFVTRETADEVELRNLAGVPTVIRKADIDQTGRREISMMPERLVDGLTVPELSSLVAYLESMRKR